MTQGFGGRPICKRCIAPPTPPPTQELPLDSALVAARLVVALPEVREGGLGRPEGNDNIGS